MSHTEVILNTVMSTNQGRSKHKSVHECRSKYVVCKDIRIRSQNNMDVATNTTMDGLSNEVVLESLLTQAIIQNPGCKIFMKSTTDVDGLSKLKYVSVCGDVMSMLNVMRAWSKRMRDTNESRVWCYKEHLNYETMCSLALAVRRLHSGCTKTVKPSSSLRFAPKRDAADKNICRLLLKRFRQNICIYSGHKSLGYMHIDSGEYVNIHNTSMIHILGQKPEFILYIHSFNDVVENVVVLEQDEVERMLSKGELEQLDFIRQNCVLKPIVFDNIGISTLEMLRLRWTKQLAGTKSIAEEIQDHTNGHRAILASSGQRSFTVFAVNQHHSIIASIVKRHLVDLGRVISEECAALPYPYQYSRTRYLVKNGLVGQSIRSSVYNTVLLIRKTNAEVPTKTDIEHAMMTLCDKVTFVEATSQRDSDNNICGRVFLHGCTSQTSLTKVPFAGFTTELDRSYNWTENTKEHCVHYNESVKVNVEPKHLLDPSRGNVTITSRTTSHNMSVKSLKRKHSDDVPRFQHLIEKRLETIPPQKLNISISRAENEYGQWKATVMFSNHNAARNSQLQHTDVVQQLCCFEICIKSEVYNVIKDSLRSLSERAAAVVVVDENTCESTIKISVCGSCVEHTAKLRKQYNCTLTPRMVRLPRRLLRQLATDSGMERLRRVMCETSTYICIPDWQDDASIYGTRRAKTKAVNALKQIIKEPAHVHFYTVNFTSSQYSPQLLIHFVQRHRIEDVFDMRAVIGESCRDEQTVFSEMPEYEHMLYDFKMDAARGCVSYRSLQTLHKSFTDYLTRLSHQCGYISDVKPDITCVVCYTTIDGNPYILETCGHAYCTDCLRMQLRVAIKSATFPVTCAADDNPFTLRDVNIICGRLRLVSLSELLIASLRRFSVTQPDVYRPCPMPNCRGLIWLPVAADTCMLCGPRRKEALDQLQMQTWMSERTDRKRCPQCRIPIEKISGCNKVACIVCLVNICWICLQFFKHQNACYEHISKAHRE